MVQCYVRNSILNSESFFVVEGMVLFQDFGMCIVIFEQVFVKDFRVFLLLRILLDIVGIVVICILSVKDFSIISLDMLYSLIFFWVYLKLVIFMLFNK